MCDYQDGPANGQGMERVTQNGFAVGVNECCRFIKHDNWRIVENRACYSQPLSFPARECCTTSTDRSVIPLRQGHNYIVNVRGGGSCNEIRIARIMAADTKV